MLSLIVSKGIVDLHGGRLSVSCLGEGHGCTFCMELAAYSAGDLDVASHDSPVSASRQSSQIQLSSKENSPSARPSKRETQTQTHDCAQDDSDHRPSFSSRPSSTAPSLIWSRADSSPPPNGKLELLFPPSPLSMESSTDLHRLSLRISSNVRSNDNIQEMGAMKEEEEGEEGNFSEMERHVRGDEHTHWASSRGRRCDPQLGSLNISSSDQEDGSRSVERKATDRPHFQASESMDSELNYSLSNSSLRRKDAPANDIITMSKNIWSQTDIHKKTQDFRMGILSNSASKLRNSITGLLVNERRPRADSESGVDMLFRTAKPINLSASSEQKQQQQDRAEYKARARESRGGTTDVGDFTPNKLQRFSSATSELYLDNMEIGEGIREGPPSPHMRKYSIGGRVSPYTVRSGGTRSAGRYSEGLLESRGGRLPGRSTVSSDTLTSLAGYDSSRRDVQSLRLPPRNASPPNQNRMSTSLPNSTSNSLSMRSRPFSYSEDITPTVQRDQHEKQEAPTNRKHRMLVVDDASLNRKMLCRLLGPRTEHCEEAANGQEAVAKFRAALVKADNQEERIYDVVLMDYHMPVMDGPTAVKEIRSLGYEGVIIGVTGNTTPHDIKNFLQSGVDQVLIKPIDLDIFDMTVAGTDR